MPKGIRGASLVVLYSANVPLLWTISLLGPVGLNALFVLLIFDGSKKLNIYMSLINKNPVSHATDHIAKVPNMTCVQFSGHMDQLPKQADTLTSHKALVDPANQRLLTYIWFVFKLRISSSFDGLMVR